MTDHRFFIRTIVRHSDFVTRVRSEKGSGEAGEAGGGVRGERIRRGEERGSRRVEGRKRKELWKRRKIGGKKEKEERSTM